MRRIIRAPWHWLLLTFACTFVGAWVSHAWEERRGLDQLIAMSDERLELYGATLDAEVSRYAHLPGLLVIDDEVIGLLRAPRDHAARVRAIRRLSRVAGRSGASELLVVGPDCALLATSRAPERGDASIGQLPPTVSRAIAEGSSGFFAYDPVQGNSDYYVVQPVLTGGEPSGFIVVRVNLAPLETTWANLGARSLSEKVMVIDDAQLIVLSSVPGWRLHTLAWPGSPAATLPGPGSASSVPDPEPLHLVQRRWLNSGARIVDVFPGTEGPPKAHVMQETEVLSLGVKLVAFSDPSDIRLQAQWAAWGGGSAGAAIGLLVLYLAYRQRSIRQMAAVQGNLKRAHDELEQLVDERTLQLQQANHELQSQIAERIKVQDELIQAGKLAALGQMSAEISHEINQPLTALRAMSRNTIMLFELGRTAAAVENLNAISGIVDRMERVARQLKSFVRKAPSLGLSFALQDAVASVAAMLEHRLRSDSVDLICDVDAKALVACDRDRLEQVLLNLCTNALDAMGGCPTRRLCITAHAVAQRWLVEVADTGIGMDEARMARLFEPFFTTKPAGEGLGLGLVIAANIVREFGSSLRARKTDIGMAFEFELDPAQQRSVIHA